jgi:hypothetical protein
MIPSGDKKAGIRQDRPAQPDGGGYRDDPCAPDGSDLVQELVPFARLNEKYLQSQLVTAMEQTVVTGYRLFRLIGGLGTAPDADVGFGEIQFPEVLLFFREGNREVAIFRQVAPAVLHAGLPRKESVRQKVAIHTFHHGIDVFKRLEVPDEDGVALRQEPFAAFIIDVSTRVRAVRYDAVHVKYALVPVGSQLDHGEVEEKISRKES